jgi:nucleolar GTP-binding protein
MADVQIGKVFKQIYLNMKRADNMSQINTYKGELIGRCTSAVKRTRKPLLFLQGARRELRKLPDIKTNMPTVVVAGFPNVGKSTLLARLTGSVPKIAAYPFTTQQLNLGYVKGLQLIDTPGLLDRLVEQRNDIELHGIIALKHLANFIVFVFDPTETCGYTLDEQHQLYEQTKKSFDVPMLVVVNKVDIETKPIKVKHYLTVSAKENIGVEQVLEYLLEKLIPEQTE